MNIKCVPILHSLANNRSKIKSLEEDCDTFQISWCECWQNHSGFTFGQLIRNNRGWLWTQCLLATSILTWTIFLGGGLEDIRLSGTLILQWASLAPPPSKCTVTSDNLCIIRIPQFQTWMVRLRLHWNSSHNFGDWDLTHNPDSSRVLRTWQPTDRFIIVFSLNWQKRLTRRKLAKNMNLVLLITLK